ncbi:thioredoxin family protein [Xylophilus ampelinus]|uniref:Thioredoxin n=1 Tax=Xylophilus ampelinus TaxID=54067 RepID=A0A318SH72_9BURK|nr:thioredoxin family protein [Xylophilus ampelinus]MCS4511598.1 thioredoxin family protein [Xylophilus ampelinus]PYE74230.1 thioredoxin [Xylophilus ampelinus]
MNGFPSGRPASVATWTVVCLCAEWCGVCRDYRPIFQRMAAASPDTAWHWLDVEDHADTAGDFDVETFPCLLVAQGERVCFLGPLTPHASVLQRLLQTLREDPASSRASMPDGADALWRRIRAASYPIPGGGRLA